MDTGGRFRHFSGRLPRASRRRVTSAVLDTTRRWVGPFFSYTRKDDRDEDREVAEEEDVARRRGVRNVDVVAANMTD